MGSGAEDWIRKMKNTICTRMRGSICGELDIIKYSNGNFVYCISRTTGLNCSLLFIIVSRMNAAAALYLHRRSFRVALHMEA